MPSYDTYILLGLVIMLESMGVPLPAESLLILLSLYASQVHHISLKGIATAAIIGAIIGDNIGYFIGYRYGYNLLEKYGPKIGLNEDRQILGRYLFRRFGGMAIFLGRFIAILRLFVALLAGASRMPWPSFLFFNILGGIVWAGGYAAITYEIGHQIDKISGTIGISLAIIALLCLSISFLFLRRHENRLIKQAREDHHQRQLQKKKHLLRTHNNHHHDNYHK